MTFCVTRVVTDDLVVFVLLPRISVREVQKMYLSILKMNHYVD